MIRTYAGHSTAAKSNELYRSNLEKGQTGLSIAFDLPTQTGYDPDDPIARGEVGKVGVPVAHRGDMEALLSGIPLDKMNTSMTINATAAWLLGLYIAVAEEQGVEQSSLSGTTQNDIIKEFLARGTYAFPPGPSLRLIADMIAYTVEEVPQWNPINICSYHLQEAGASPVQEIAFAMSNAIAVLDAAQERVPADKMPAVFGRISFFVNAGMRFIEEHAKLRAMTILWEEIGRERYGVTDERQLRLRYGVQVNSLGLTESQPENNVPRIVLEMLSVTLGRDARARAIQLPAWNEALGLPRPWDQQWSLRIQQLMAYETDILEYPDIFEGSVVMDGLVAEMLEGARAEMEVVNSQGGAVEAVEYMKSALVDSHRDRMRRIEGGEQTVVGLNRFTETEESPLMAGSDGGILTVDPALEAEQAAAVKEWRDQRDGDAAAAAIAELERVAADQSVNIMPATIAAARAGVTTGEWSAALRQCFGEYRAPTGVGGGSSAAANDETLTELRAEVNRVSEALGRRIAVTLIAPSFDGCCLLGL
jgi:(2R)-ethylmalonyl-CoA mutase